MFYIRTPARRRTHAHAHIHARIRIHTHTPARLLYISTYIYNIRIHTGEHIHARRRAYTGGLISFMAWRVARLTGAILGLQKKYLKFFHFFIKIA